MKRKTSFFLERSKNSLVLAIELFNRPSELGREEGVVLFLDHAFEMLLKAIIFEKTGRLRKRGDKFNYGFDKCASICRDNLKLIDNDEALILTNLNCFRDAAVHDIVIISEGLLYSHAQSAVQIFGRLLSKVFKEDLADVMPLRILPISTSIPQDVQVLVSSDLDAARSMLGGRQRKEDEAEARLRPYEIIERNLRILYGSTIPLPSIKQVIRRIKTGDWKTVLPMVGGLMQSSTTGIPISIHISKREGIPVRIDPEAPTAIAFRYVKPEDKYPYLTSELAEKLGTTVNKTVAIVKLLGMKGKDEYHTSIKASRASYVQRYSEKAFQILKTAIEREGVDALWQASKSSAQKVLEDYLPLQVVGRTGVA